MIFEFVHTINTEMIFCFSLFIPPTTMYHLHQLFHFVHTTNMKVIFCFNVVIRQTPIHYQHQPNKQVYSLSLLLTPTLMKYFGSAYLYQQQRCTTNTRVVCSSRWFISPTLLYYISFDLGIITNPKQEEVFKRSDDSHSTAKPTKSIDYLVR